MSLEMITHAYETHADFAKAFQTLGLAKPDISSVFYMMDEDRTGVVNHEEFAEHLLKMKTHDEHGVVIMIKKFKGFEQRSNMMVPGTSAGTPHFGSPGLEM